MDLDTGETHSSFMRLPAAFLWFYVFGIWYGMHYFWAETYDAEWIVSAWQYAILAAGVVFIVSARGTLLKIAAFSILCCGALAAPGILIAFAERPDGLDHFSFAPPSFPVAGIVSFVCALATKLPRIRLIEPPA